MEFFIPSLFLFLLVAIVVIGFLPKLSPLILVVLAGLLLVFGVYNHYMMFRDEYKLSTWQDGLKSFAPGIMIAVIILFILYFITSLFTGGQVPIPSMPNVSVANMPPAETATNYLTSTLNNVTSAVANTTSAVANKTTGFFNNIGKTTNGTKANATANATANTTAGQKNGKNNANKGNNITRSFLEVL